MSPLGVVWWREQLATSTKPSPVAMPLATRMLGRLLRKNPCWRQSYTQTNTSLFKLFYICFSAASKYNSHRQDISEQLKSKLDLREQEKPSVDTNKSVYNTDASKSLPKLSREPTWNLPKSQNRKSSVEELDRYFMIFDNVFFCANFFKCYTSLIIKILVLFFEIQPCNKIYSNFTTKEYLNFE